MSTILDALKRLEDEDRREKRRQSPSSMRAEAGSRSLVGRRAAFFIIAVLVVLGAAAAFTWIKGGFPEKSLLRATSHLDPKLTADREPEPTTSKAPPMAAESAAAAKGAARLSANRPAAPAVSVKPAQPSKQRVPPNYSKQFQARRVSERPSWGRVEAGRRDSASEEPSGQAALRPARQAGHPAPQAVTSETAQPLSAEDLSEAKSAPRRIGVNEASPFSDKAAKLTKAAPPAKGALPHDEAESLGRGILQLQAISWSDIPSERLTVIDGRILREGQSVEGYTVIQIRPEDIIVGKSGKQWKLGYGGR